MEKRELDAAGPVSPDAIPPEWARAFSWVEKELGGRIVRARRQPRWRPAWFLDLEREGNVLPLYFRGARGEAEQGVYDLQHEMGVLRVLERHGIPVPHVHAFCPAPEGIVMERARGLANLAHARDPAEREAVLDHYVELLVQMHGLDTADFEALGIRRPRDPREIGLADHPVWERAYRRARVRPDPAIEFLIQWVRRNVPMDRNRVSFVCVDSGQFLFEEGRVTAVIDLELAGIGDPLADLAGLRGRDLSEPLGDLGRATRRYEELTGEPLDRSAIDYHTVRFGLVTPLAVARVVAEPPPGFDWVQYAAWYTVWTRCCLEVIAESRGFELPRPELPSGLLADANESAGGAPPESSAFDGYARETEQRTATYRERLDRFGPEIFELDREAARPWLSAACDGSASLDRALEERVEGGSPDGDEDEMWLPLLHGRLCRQEAVLRPLLRELQDVRMQALA